MRFCFIVEKRYVDDEMPLAAVEPLERRGHSADVLTPQVRVTSLWDLGQNGSAYDAYVLKTASDGPGLTILEAAGAAGIPTVNDWRSISLVRDKAVAVARARAHGLPVPRTYFVSALNLLGQIGPEQFPLVVKPNNGSAGRAIRRVDSFRQLLDLDLDEREARHFVAQTYVPNDGFDVKLYNTGQDIFAIRWPSPLHPEVDVTPGLLPLTPDLKAIATAFGRVFGLRIYGVDVLRSWNGWVAVDVNDFPSFHLVPDASERVAASVIQMAEQAARRREARVIRASNHTGPAGRLSSEATRGLGSDDRPGRRPYDQTEWDIASLPDH